MALGMLLKLANGPIETIFSTASIIAAFGVCTLIGVGFGKAGAQCRAARSCGCIGSRMKLKTSHIVLVDGGVGAVGVRQHGIAPAQDPGVAATYRRWRQRKERAGGTTIALGKDRTGAGLDAGHVVERLRRRAPGSHGRARARSEYGAGILRTFACSEPRYSAGLATSDLLPDIDVSGLAARQQGAERQLDGRWTAYGA